MLVSPSLGPQPFTENQKNPTFCGPEVIGRGDLRSMFSHRALDIHNPWGEEEKETATFNLFFSRHRGAEKKP